MLAEPGFSGFYFKAGLFYGYILQRAASYTIHFDASDPIDLVIICVHKNNRKGHFVFNKKILLEKRIFSRINQGGKRAIRVYLPWDLAANKQAQASQHWQLKYFFEFGPDIKLDIQKIKLLFAHNS
jgi:hypothetical protein